MRLNAPIISSGQSRKRVAPMSYQEMAYAPSLLQKRHEAAQAELAANEEALQFEYLNQDDAVVRERIKQHQNKLDTLSKQLAGSGVGSSTPVRQEIANFKRDYIRDTGPSGILGKASKNYSDAMNTWTEWQKANKDKPMEYQNAAKNKIFGKYQGMQDEFGNLRDFEAGDVSGYYDPRTEIETSMSKVKGKLGELAQSGIPASINIKKLPDGTTYAEIVNTRTGYKINNSDAIAGEINAILADYNDPTKTTDRSKFKDMMGISNDYIEGLAQNIGKAYTQNTYGQAPGSSTNLRMLSKPSTNGTSSKTPTIPIFPTVDIMRDMDPKIQERINEDIELLTGYDPTVSKADLVAKRADTLLASKTGVIGMSTSKESKELSTKISNYDRQKERYNYYQDKYKSLKKLFDDDSGFIKTAMAIEQKDAAFEDSYANFKNYDFVEDVIQSANTLGNDGKIFTSEDNEDGITREKLESKLGDYTLADYPGWMNSKGEVIMSLPTGKKGAYEEWKVGGLPNANSRVVKAINDLHEDLKDYSLTDAEIKQLNGTTIPIGDNSAAGVYIDPANPAMRQPYTIQRDKPLYDEEGNVVQYTWGKPKPTTLAKLRQLALFETSSILKKDYTK